MHTQAFETTASIRILKTVNAYASSDDRCHERNPFVDAYSSMMMDANSSPYDRCHDRNIGADAYSCCKTNAMFAILVLVTCDDPGARKMWTHTEAFKTTDMIAILRLARCGCVLRL